MDNAADDDEIVLRLLDRDQDALRELTLRYGGYLLNAVRRHYGHLLSEEDIEEVVQDTFLKAWNHIGEYDDRKAKLTTWLFAVAKNVAIDHMRRSAHVLEVVNPREDADHPEDRRPPMVTNMSPEKTQSLSRLSDAMGHLSDLERAIVETDAHVGIEASTSLMKKQSGLPAGTIRVYRCRALKKLRDALTKANGEAGRS